MTFSIVSWAKKCFYYYDCFYNWVVGENTEEQKKKRQKEIYSLYKMVYKQALYCQTLWQISCLESFIEVQIKDRYEWNEVYLFIERLNKIIKKMKKKIRETSAV